MGDFLRRLSRRRELPNIKQGVIPFLSNRLHNILSESAPLFAVLVLPTSSMAAITKAFTTLPWKVTGATQKLVSAVNHTR